MSRSRLLVSDFDGTLTAVDFYQRVVDRFLEPADLRPWERYLSGELTHFEALRDIFGKLRVETKSLVSMLDEMRLQPGLADCVARLKAAGWELVIVSNGCQWYIRKLLEQQRVDVPVFANPGDYSPAQGLVMELPLDSPYFSANYGIDKNAVIEAARREGRLVAFAGNGKPDVVPALSVDPEFRFATGFLADELSRLGEPFRRFSVWKDIVEVIAPHG